MHATRAGLWRAGGRPQGASRAPRAVGPAIQQRCCSGPASRPEGAGRHQGMARSESRTWEQGNCERGWRSIGGAGRKAPRGARHLSKAPMQISPVISPPVHAGESTVSREWISAGGRAFREPGSGARGGGGSAALDHATSGNRPRNCARRVLNPQFHLMRYARQCLQVFDQKDVKRAPVQARAPPDGGGRRRRVQAGCLPASLHTRQPASCCGMCGPREAIHRDR